jgi:hypothetical protein
MVQNSFSSSIGKQYGKSLLDKKVPQRMRNIPLITLQLTLSIGPENEDDARTN